MHRGDTTAMATPLHIAPTIPLLCLFLAIEFLKPHFQQSGFHGCGGLSPSCGSRYESLEMSDNGQEYEMVNQLATALKTDGGPLPGDFGPVSRVFMSGQSQQGGSVITHAGEFHFANIDGYFFMGASGARELSNDAPRLQGNTPGRSRTPGATTRSTNNSAHLNLVRLRDPVPP